MRSMIGLCGALSLIAAAEAATAAPVNYDCDTPAGSFSELSQVQAGPAFHVRGTITPLQWRDHRRWAPLGQVRIETSDRSRSIAVRVIRPRGAERAEFDIAVDNGSGVVSSELGSLALNEALSFDISLIANGDTVVQIGAERRSYRLDLGRNVQVSAVCSTGEFLFRELDLGG